MGAPEPSEVNNAAIPATVAFFTWLAAWVLGPMVFGAIVLLAMGTDPEAPRTVPEMAATLIVGWATYLVAAWNASRTAGTGDMVVDLGIRFKPIDLVGLPAGVLTQLAIVPALYWPLRELWPETFSENAVGERSREIVEGASNSMLILLGALLVIGAPIVEEIVYRGLLQRSFARQWGRVGAWLGIAGLFAAIHFSPVEIPGLFAAGLLFGAGVAMTGRIGPGVMAHVGFNATALIVLL